MMDTTAIGLLAAFAAGIASFLSPCVLPLVPGYMSYVAGAAAAQGPSGQTERRWSAAALAFLFVLGFSLVFIALGATASAMGQLLLKYRYEAGIASGLVIIVFGLFMVGALDRVSWFQRDWRWNPRLAGGRPTAALALGVAFGFGWTPCIGPVLGAILTMAAFTSQADGVVLLAVYAAGLGVPFLLAALFTERMLHHAASLRRLSRPLQRVGGVVLIVMGIAMATGQLSVFAIWLLRAVPALGRIG